jgi:hypothetical protein
MKPIGYMYISLLHQNLEDFISDIPPEGRVIHQDSLEWAEQVWNLQHALNAPMLSTGTVFEKAFNLNPLKFKRENDR